MLQLTVGLALGGAASAASLGRAPIANGEGRRSSLITALLLIAQLLFAAPVLAQPEVSTIGVGVQPFGVAVNQATNRIYVANFGSQSISVIDGAANSVVTTISLGAHPSFLAVNPATNRVYVTAPEIDRLLVIDSGTNAVIDSIAVGTFPLGVAVNPTTNRIYVANNFSNTSDSGNLSVINGATNTVLDTVPLCFRPLFVAANATTNRIYVTDEVCGFISVIDGVTHSVANIAGVAPHGVAVNETTDRVYVTNDVTNTVSVLEGASNLIVATVPVGNSPTGVATDQITNRIYAANSGYITVSVIDGATNTVASTVALASSPHSIAVNASTRRVYVSNPNAGTVSVIELPIPFAAFSANLEVDLRHRTNDDRFAMNSTFTLAAASDGIDPIHENVQLALGTFSITVPAGAFVPNSKGHLGFQGIVDGVSITAQIRPLGGGSFQFRVDGQGAELNGLVNPIEVGLTIGNDGGTTPVAAQIK